MRGSPPSAGSLLENAWGDRMNGVAINAAWSAMTRPAKESPMSVIAEAAASRRVMGLSA